MSPYDTNALIKQTQNMLAQTAAQGATPFKGSSYDTPQSRIGAVQAITPTSLTSTQPLTPTPQAPLPTITTPVLSTPVESPVEPAPLPQETRIYDLMKGLTDDTKSLGSEEAFKAQQEAQQNIIAKKNTVASIKNQFDALTKANQGIDIQSQQDIQNLQLQAQGQGVTAGGLAPRQREIITRANQAKLTNTIKQYELGAQHAVASGDLATALDYVDQAVRLEYQPKKDALDAKRADIELLLKDPTLTAAQEARAQELKRKYAQEDAQLEAAKKDKEVARLWGLEAAKNGASSLLLSQISGKTPEQILSIPNIGEYLSDPIEKARQYESLLTARQNRAESEQKLPYEIEVLKATASKTKQEAKQVAVAEEVSNLNPESPTFTMDSIRASKGGKIATGEQTKPINKAMLVVSQIDSLQQQVQGMDTGPILGILRDNNPYDVKARLLKATLQATVPNLARGVYGEVGVLTDTDIANYIKTLPNVKSPRELNDLVLAMTLRTVKNGIDSNLQVLSAEGRDVSGFEPLYTRLQKKVSELESKSSGTTLMIGPDGKQYNVPSAQVEAFIKDGGKRI